MFNFYEVVTGTSFCISRKGKENWLYLGLYYEYAYFNNYITLNFEQWPIPGADKWTGDLTKLLLPATLILQMSLYWPILKSIDWLGKIEKQWADHVENQMEM